MKWLFLLSALCFVAAGVVALSPILSQYLHDRYAHFQQVTESQLFASQTLNHALGE